MEVRVLVFETCCLSFDQRVGLSFAGNIFHDLELILCQLDSRRDFGVLGRALGQLLAYTEYGFE